MPTPHPLSRFNTGYLLRALSLLVAVLLPLPTTAQPVTVTSQLAISNGNWYPLTETEMKAAAGDTALAELSSSGLLRIVDNDDGESGALRLTLSLIGQAETAMLTIELPLPERPSYISTASISVHDLDYQGIYNTFEHVGTTAAQRLNATVNAERRPSTTQLPLSGDGASVDDQHCLPSTTRHSAPSAATTTTTARHRHYSNRWRRQRGGKRTAGKACRG